MSKTIDARIPREAGKGTIQDYPAIGTPWNKLISYHDAVHFTARFTSVVGAAAMQAFRILVPDYEERAEIICQNTYNRMYPVFSSPYGPMMGIDFNNIHPFMKGTFVGGLNGDNGDESLLMCGRANDFGTHRVEKELDVCYWDIVGSELCRATTLSLRGVAEGEATHLKNGPQLDYHMVEAKGCGDRHCRIVAECRKKYPMPDHKIWECMGPIATADQIKFTEEEDCVSESQIFREETGYCYTSGTCKEDSPSSAYDSGYFGSSSNSVSSNSYIFPAIEDAIAAGKVTAEFADHVIKCVLEAAGKAAFGDFYTKKGLREWLGAPESVDDGRLMGAYLEIVLECLRVPFETEAFNENEVIYVIDREKLASRTPKLVDAYVSYWYGMTRSLVSAQWFLWEEDSPEGKLRLKIAKKIDKFC